MERRPALQRSQKFRGGDGSDARLGAVRDQPADGRGARQTFCVQQRRDAASFAYLREGHGEKRGRVRGTISFSTAGRSLPLEAFADGIAGHGGRSLHFVREPGQNWFSVSEEWHVGRKTGRSRGLGKGLGDVRDERGRRAA